MLCRWVHELSPYGLSDKEWRAYLLYLVKKDDKKTTLAQISRKLVKELTVDLEKEPLSAKAMKHAKLYLTKIKQDRFNIKFLLECFPAYTNKRSRDKTASSDNGSDIKRQDRRSLISSSNGKKEVKKDREHSTSRQRERELKAFLGVISQWSTSVTQKGSHTTVRRANVNAWPDDASADDQQLFAEVLTPHVLPETAEFNTVNPMLSGTLFAVPVCS